MRPATSALLDQADAAGAHAAAIMRTLAALEGSGPVRNETPGPVYTAIIRRLHQRGRTGQLTLCPHLSYTAPEPAFWCAWAPGRLRCAICTVQAQKRIRGTREDRRCDHCRKTGPTIHPDMAQLPAVVADLPAAAMCIPPITVMFGLCPACQKADTRKREPSP